MKPAIKIKTTNFFLPPLLAFLLVLIGTSVCLAQNTTRRLATRVGQLLSNGTNAMPVGELRVKTYRLELVRLDKPINIGNSLPPLHTVFRIKITLETQFPPGFLTLWLDDNALDAIEVSPTEVVSIIYSRTLPDGATLALSKPSENDQLSRSTLPEVLQVPAPYIRDSSLRDGDGSIIRLRRISKFIPEVNSQVLGVEIEIASPKRYQVRNELLLLEIGNKQFPVGLHGNGRVLRLWLADENFLQLNNGDKIIAKYGFGPRGAFRRVLGRLNKSSIM